MKLDVYQVVSIVGCALALFFAVIDVVVSARKKRNVSLYKIMQKIPGFILEAESILFNASGPSKLAYVLNCIQNACVMNHVKYNKEAFTQEVENLLATPQKKEFRDQPKISGTSPSALDE